MNILNPRVWTSASSPRSNGGSAANDGNESRVLQFSLFAALITFLTIIANLMGPAGGVLVLPTIQCVSRFPLVLRTLMVSFRWVNTQYKLQEQFHGLLGPDPPSGRGALANCSVADLADEEYTCTNYVYGPMMESIIFRVIASTRGNAFDEKPRLLGSTLVFEAMVHFTFENMTAVDADVILILNRQALRFLSTHTMNEYELIPSTARILPNLKSARNISASRLMFGFLI